MRQRCQFREACYLIATNRRANALAFPAEEEPLASGIVADVGGTHARLATAAVTATTIRLDRVETLRTADFASFEAAFRHYAESLPGRPASGAFALASPVTGDAIKLTNHDWVLRPAGLAERLGLERVTLLNDFEAIARGVGRLSDDALRPIGPAPFILPQEGMVSIVGPGSGLGVGMLLRTGGHDRVIACEGGHVGFAPADEIDVKVAEIVTRRYPRLSAERLIAGPGLAEIYCALAELDDRPVEAPDPIAL